MEGASGPQGASACSRSTVWMRRCIGGHDVSDGTYGAPRLHHALTRGDAEAGVRAVAQLMRRQGLTDLNTLAAPGPAVGLQWPMRTTAPASGTKVPLTACK